MQKADFIQSLDTDQKLNMMVRMEQTARVFQKQIKAEETRIRYRTEKKREKETSKCNRNSSNSEDGKAEERACPYDRQSSSFFIDIS